MVHIDAISYIIQCDLSPGCWYIGGPMNKVTIPDSEEINKVGIYKYIGSKTRHFNNLMSLMES